MNDHVCGSAERNARASQYSCCHCLSHGSITPSYERTKHTPWEALLPRPQTWTSREFGGTLQVCCISGAMALLRCASTRSLRHSCFQAQPPCVIKPLRPQSTACAFKTSLHDLGCCPRVPEPSRSGTDRRVHRSRIFAVSRDNVATRAPVPREPYPPYTPYAALTRLSQRTSYLLTR